MKNEKERRLEELSDQKQVLSSQLADLNKVQTDIDR